MYAWGWKININLDWCTSWRPVVRCKNLEITIDDFCLYVVDDVEVFNAYPSGRRCFLETMHAFKIMHKMKDSKLDRKYDVYGFPLVVQVEVHTVLTPTLEKMENRYIQEFYIPSRVPDPILDAYIFGEERQSHVAHRSPTQHRVLPFLPLTYHRGTSSHLFHTLSSVRWRLGSLDIEIEEVTDGELVLDTDRVTDGVVTELETGSQQQVVEIEQPEIEMETRRVGSQM
ncbi:hypothetical protein Adt_21427 [Abeliophyllum distichum]|uniref:Uncharacterized protein n=1 Tax=Abeliophyllum distichum TaxID=126358 RepID=A0ABD1SZB1_9LAMI